MELNTLTIIERAMLSNQFRILSFLDHANSESHLADAEIFENGFTGLYFDALQHIRSAEVAKEVCTETHDILTMYRYISNAIASLTPTEKAGLDLNQIMFDGFDANNDDHYHFTVFMIEKQHKYKEHSADHINSHSMLSIIRYREMLPVYKDILAQHINEFGVNELQRLIDAV